MDKKIPAYMFSGFLDSGKTTYIMDTIFNDFFHKKGTTLILSFEEGETAYDTERLKEYRTFVANYDMCRSFGDFCEDAIKKYRPDRIYIEDNSMIPDLAELLPSCIDIKAKTSLISGVCMDVYFANMRQIMQNIISGAVLVIFNRVESREDLDPYAQICRLMNREAAFLWEGPTGYHEKAFGNALTYDISLPKLIIEDKDYPCFYLDGYESPANYAGKEVELTVQVRARPGLPSDMFFAGRMVMTCCLADIQFLGFPCRKPENIEISENQWIRLTAKCSCEKDPSGYRNVIIFNPVSISQTAPPKEIAAGISKN